MLSELPLVKAIQPLNLCKIESYYVNLTPWIYAAFIQLFTLFIQLGNKKTEINTTKQLLHEQGLLWDKHEWNNCVIEFWTLGHLEIKAYQFLAWQQFVQWVFILAHTVYKLITETETLMNGLTQNTRGYLSISVIYEQQAKCPHVFYVKPSNKGFIILLQRHLILLFGLVWRLRCLNMVLIE